MSKQTYLTVGARLREERERLGMNQTELAKVGNVSLRTQMRFEADERSPDADYLASVAKAGANVQYIVTSKR